MAPGNNERHPGHTGTIPKTKVRNNYNVPQEAVTPTRRDMTTNLVSTSLDWVPVSEYNSRTNYSQTRKQTNNTSDHELTDLDNSVSYDRGFGRFVPVRPQPRALPLNVQNSESISSEQQDDVVGSSMSGHALHPYSHQMQNGLIHSNHAAAAVMIVNPTTPNAVTGSVSQPFNAPNQNRNNLTRNLNSSRNNFDGANHSNNSNTTPPITNSRTTAKTVNLMNNMYDQGQGSFNNLNETNHVHRESARALGEAIVAACPDAVAVERRLGQIREYIRVTSTLVDTMRNSEDEAFIDHTKEEYDELVEMVMKLKDSENNLETFLNERRPDNIEVPADETTNGAVVVAQQDNVTRPVSVQSNGSTYSDNELWQNEIKSKMELSQMRLAALKQQQKRLLKYQEEAKQQLEEINRERQAQDQPSNSHDNFAIMQNQSYSGTYQHPNRMYAANQIGVATTLPQSTEQHQQNMANNVDHEQGHSVQDERFSNRDANITGSEAGVGDMHSEGEDDGPLSDRGRMLQIKLRELQMKKQHMENVLLEFQKLQMANRLSNTHNTYSSSGEDSGADEPSRKCSKSGGNNKNDDPFKFMEIKTIKTALQKTQDLMRSVENYESEHLSGGHEYMVPQAMPFRDNISTHSNMHDNKSEGGGSMGGWSNEGSVCRVRNTLPQRQKFTNEQQHPQVHMQHPQQMQQQQQSHEANIASLQELAQELRMETEKVIGERARIKEMISNKELSRKQKKVNEEIQAGPSGVPGPVERRQMQLRALLADKQRELEALLNKEKVLCSGPEIQNTIRESHSDGSIINQSYISEQEGPQDRSSQILMDSHNSREPENFVGDGDITMSRRPVPGIPSHLGSNYGSDSDCVSRNKFNQRNRPRRRQPQERQIDDITVSQPNNTNQYLRNEPRVESSNVNMVPPTTQTGDNSIGGPYPHPPPCWNTTKSNQDMRTNQFTQNSHSQTIDRLLGTPQMSFPPSMPFNMMMPYGMVGGCGCGCGFWGSWCWQQLVLQQREIHQLREQLNHVEERWRVETASHTLNNQVPPGNRANNYWDNFRSYSRQNLLSANNKANADGHLGVGVPHNPHPLVERSHNTLHHTSSGGSPCVTPKRNTNTTSSSHNASNNPQINNEEILVNRHPPRRNIIYERSLSFSSAPDVLNVNQNNETETVSTTSQYLRNIDDAAASVSNVKINRQDSFRNLNITNPIPEIIQAHSNNLNTSSSNTKKKSSSKLPAKNSTNRRNCSLDYSQTSNINIASTSEIPNPNLASTSRESNDKATSKLFDLLRENIYSEVTTLIGVNESHPDFLIQLFRELQLISSNTLRQKVLQSIRNVLSQYSSLVESENSNEDVHPEVVSTTGTEQSNYECSSLSMQNACLNTVHIDPKVVSFLIMKSEETCTLELLETLASHILSSTTDCRYSQQMKRRLIEMLSKYEGARVRDITSDVIENLPLYIATNVESEPVQRSSDMAESSILQDVAGSLNLFNANNSHQINTCPYDLWTGHLHMDIEGTDLNDDSPRSSQNSKVDLINCSEMHNGDLAEADQTCHTEMDGVDGNSLDETGANAEALPDVVDTEEVTPTEAEAEWLGLDCVPTRLHMEESSGKQKD